LSLLESQELEHARQASRVRLKLYRYLPPPEELPAGMAAQEGFLLTEERVGTAVVVSTLGFFADEGAARSRMRQRAEELARQGYGPPTGPPLRPSLPPGALAASERARKPA
jgi:hypothetical protein